MEERDFDVLDVTMDSEEDSPVLKADVQNGAGKQVSTIMRKMPKKSPQAKAKQENRTNGDVVRVGRTFQTFAKIGLSDKGEMLSRGGCNCHPLLVRRRRRQGHQGDLYEGKSWQL